MNSNYKLNIDEIEDYNIFDEIKYAFKRSWESFFGPSEPKTIYDDYPRPY